MTQTLVSVVIATRNEEKNIGNCLESIENQSYKNIETIVVDSNSQDKTRGIAERHSDKVYNLIEHAKRDEFKNYRGAQLNLGVEKSKGKIIFFPDADMTFDKNLIAEAVEKMENLDALYVPETIVGNGFLRRIRNFERSFYNETCIDAVRIVKKKMFLDIGGFDAKNIAFGPDDWDFTKRIKQKTNKISITESVVYHNEGNFSFGTYLEKKRKYAPTFDDYIKKWGRTDPDVMKQLGPNYRLFWVFVERGKWKRLIMDPLSTIGMLALRASVGIGFLMR